MPQVVNSSVPDMVNTHRYLCEWCPSGSGLMTRRAYGIHIRKCPLKLIAEAEGREEVEPDFCVYCTRENHGDRACEEKVMFMLETLMTGEASEGMKTWIMCELLKVTPVAAAGGAAGDQNNEVVSLITEVILHIFNNTMESMS